MVRRTTRRPVVLKRSKTQTGRSNKAVDRTRTALAPGKRKSKSGKIYTEKRANRSDKSRRLKL